MGVQFPSTLPSHYVSPQYNVQKHNDLPIEISAQPSEPFARPMFK